MQILKFTGTYHQVLPDRQLYPVELPQTGICKLCQSRFDGSEWDALICESCAFEETHCTKCDKEIIYTTEPKEHCHACGCGGCCNVIYDFKCDDCADIEDKSRLALKIKTLQDLSTDICQIMTELKTN